ncbi:receiver box response regulator [Natrialba magadii ATCC 43099]|uniref:Receiver box response regulator n=1 Tax=Natrialba magadii (strain ATCC 43099 / DSM 3394 / CCM 3739 / CIP 104546 / IAM 13178 / JCM 8861 / NBRC 102185 / NCIMB 2190 / MS3) TaxID=547559 RepID=D3SUW3_NATMM|nr:response regulator [Natrialba magadii]ADD05371.1 receiver box response regulator [Natrialba magadii ATCC 43099]ELY29313.1 response regulator receiver protein [Natrialba magadii ATCC 43099]
MSVDILLIDATDNSQHIQKLLAGTERTTVHLVQTGTEALEFLTQRGSYSNAASPELVLLNPQLPDVDGYDLLRNLKNEPELRAIPVIILSEFDREEDIIESYSHHANAYIHLPDDPHTLAETITGIKSFWLDIAHLPSLQ